MKIIIAIFGALICLAGLLILVSPQKFKNLMNNLNSQPRFLFAIIIRLIIGAILLYEAANLRFPLVMKIIGVVFIIAAIGILIAGRQRLDRTIDYWMNRSQFVMRVASFFAIPFGAFLVYVTI